MRATDEINEAWIRSLDAATMDGHDTRRLIQMALTCLDRINHPSAYDAFQAVADVRRALGAADLESLGSAVDRAIDARDTALREKDAAIAALGADRLRYHGMVADHKERLLQYINDDEKLRSEKFAVEGERDRLQADLVVEVGRVDGFQATLADLRQILAPRKGEALNAAARRVAATARRVASLSVIPRTGAARGRGGETTTGAYMKQPDPCVGDIKTWEDEEGKHTAVVGGVYWQDECVNELDLEVDGEGDCWTIDTWWAERPGVTWASAPPPAPTACDARGPMDARCDLPPGHEGLHESADYVWCSKGHIAGYLAEYELSNKYGPSYVSASGVLQLPADVRAHLRCLPDIVTFAGFSDGTLLLIPEEVLRTWGPQPECGEFPAYDASLHCTKPPSHNGPHVDPDRKVEWSTPEEST